MKKRPEESGGMPKAFSLRSWLFPACVAAAYLILWTLAPERTANALCASGHIFRQVACPLALAVSVMVLLNRFVTPAHGVRFLGRRAGWLGALLSTTAGIVSMGPIYAWYPFLASLREKGASSFHLANFLGNRAVKPVLLPVMIAYFGWRFALVFSLAGLCNAFLAAALVSLLARPRPERNAPEGR